jgi:hypothetical protein
LPEFAVLALQRLQLLGDIGGQAAGERNGFQVKVEPVAIGVGRLDLVVLLIVGVSRWLFRPRLSRPVG